MAKIESVEFCDVKLALDRPTSFSSRTVTARHYGLVKLRSVDGIEGIGFPD